MFVGERGGGDAIITSFQEREMLIFLLQFCISLSATPELQ